MTLQDVFSLIQKTLAEQGFKLTSLTRNSAECSCWVLQDELQVRKVNPATEYTAFFGNCIEVRVCPHRNGSKADTSYYIAIEEVDRSSFRDYKKIKLMRAQMEQTLTRKIVNLVNEYKQVLAEKALAKKIDEFLNLSPDER